MTDPTEGVAAAVAKAEKAADGSGMLRAAGGASLPLLVVWFLLQQSIGGLKTDMGAGMAAVSTTAAQSSQANREAITEVKHAVENLREDVKRLGDDGVRRVEFEAWVRELRALNLGNGIQVPEPSR